MARRTPARGATDPGRKNLRFWQRISAGYEAKHGAQLSVEDGQAWGFWRIPERDLDLLGPVAGRRVLELGCGAASWSIGLAHRGAQVVGLDFSSSRLRQASRGMHRAHVRFPLVAANAERLPVRDATFDTVFCDWGAMTFSDPSRTVPEVARILRPGGLFVFASSSPLRFLCLDPASQRMTRRLVRDYFDQHRVEFPNAVDYSLPYGEWIRLFGENGLVVERLVEPRGGPDRKSSYLTRSERLWSGHFPLESIWRLRRTGESKPTARDGKPHPRARPARRHG